MDPFRPLPPNPDSGTRSGLATLGVLTLFFLGLTTFWVLHRVEMLDEGWYAYAGKLAWRGELPYRDFAYLQAPLLPYLYGLPQKLGPGMLSGRIAAAAFALGTWLLVLGLARQLGGTRAAVCTALLFLGAVYLGSHFPIILTYSPAAFFLMLALHALVRQRLLLCVLAVAVAAGVRLSLAPAVPLLALAAWWGSSRTRPDAVRLALGGAIAVAAFAGFVLPDPAVAWHDLVGFHTTGATVAERVRQSVFSVAESFATTGVLLVAAALAPLVRRDVAHVRVLAALAGTVFAANLVPSTTAPYYQSVLLPLLALLGGLTLARLRSTAILTLLLLVHLAGQLEPARRHAVARRVPGAGPLTFEPRLPKIAAVGADLRRLVPPGGKVFTTATYFAIEADVDVMRGLEMSIFSIDWAADAETCRRRHTVNPEMIRDWFTRGVPDVVLLTGWDVAQLGGRTGPILAPLTERYEVRGVHRRVGQLDGDVFLITRAGSTP